MIDTLTGAIAVPPYADFVLPHWREARARGLRCALLTIIGSTGPSPRPVGSQLSVSEDGGALGLLSGGCIETSLVRDAVRHMGLMLDYVNTVDEARQFIAASGISPETLQRVDRAAEDGSKTISYKAM